MPLSFPRIQYIDYLESKRALTAMVIVGLFNLFTLRHCIKVPNRRLVGVDMSGIPSFSVACIMMLKAKQSVSSWLEKTQRKSNCIYREE